MKGMFMSFFWVPQTPHLAIIFFNLLFSFPLLLHYMHNVYTSNHCISLLSYKYACRITWWAFASLKIPFSFEYSRFAVLHVAQWTCWSDIPCMYNVKSEKSNWTQRRFQTFSTRNCAISLEERMTWTIAFLHFPTKYSSFLSQVSSYTLSFLRFYPAPTPTELITSLFLLAHSSPYSYW